MFHLVTAAAGAEMWYTLGTYCYELCTLHSVFFIFYFTFFTGIYCVYL